MREDIFSTWSLWVTPLHFTFKVRFSLISAEELPIMIWTSPPSTSNLLSEASQNPNCSHFSSSVTVVVSPGRKAIRLNPLSSRIGLATLEFKCFTYN